MTPSGLLTNAVELYEQTLKKKVTLGGSQILFIDDSKEMLQYIQIQLECNYGMMQGYIIEPNPVFALHVLEFIIAKGITLDQFIKCAVLDIDYGVYNRQVTVNDLLKLLLHNNIPVILFSSYDPDKWKTLVDPIYHDRVKYICKSDKNSMGLVYAQIQEYNTYEVR